MNTFNIAAIKETYKFVSEVVATKTKELEGVSRREERVLHKSISKDLNKYQDIQYDLQAAFKKEYANKTEITLTSGPTIDFLNSMQA